MQELHCLALPDMLPPSPSMPVVANTRTHAFLPACLSDPPPGIGGVPFPFFSFPVIYNYMSCNSALQPQSHT